jgi:hypothetical protein
VSQFVSGTDRLPPFNEGGEQQTMSDMLGSSARARRGLRAIGALAFVTVAFAAAAGSALAAQVNIVRQGAPSAAAPANTEYFKTIQAAVNATAAGSWVLIGAGV